METRTLEAIMADIATASSVAGLAVLVIELDALRFPAPVVAAAPGGAQIGGAGAAQA